MSMIYDEIINTCFWLFPDSEEEMKALEADLLTNMYTSKVIIFTLLADG